MYKRNKEQIHFIGIGGIGMSGIAEVLARQGFPVSGSDISDSDILQKLQKLGVKTAIGHCAENLLGAKVVVYSSAIGPNNPEILEAKRLGLPLVPRAGMLAELMRLKFGIAIAGTHGKTTTTSMLATILTHAGVDPTVIVGGKVDALGGNAKLGQGQFLIAEADESDGSFLSLSPVITMVTNIDNDHLDFYKKMENLRQAFVDFINKVPYYGRSILCIDDPGILKILPLVTKPHWTYGFSQSAHFQITDYEQKELGSTFKVNRDGSKFCELTLQVPGNHNALNAVAAFVAALELDMSVEQAKTGLAQFRGVRRRFEIKGKWQGVTIVDDYGHHPTEIAATLLSAKNWWKGRIVVAFQPHRYTRTQLCWDRFPEAFKLADEVLLLDIYPASEAVIPTVNSENLAKTMQKTKYIGSLIEAKRALKQGLRPGDLLITLGAGNITQLGPMLLSMKDVSQKEILEGITRSKEMLL